MSRKRNNDKTVDFVVNLQEIYNSWGLHLGNASRKELEDQFEEFKKKNP